LLVSYFGQQLFDALRRAPTALWLGLACGAALRCSPLQLPSSGGAADRQAELRHRARAATPILLDQPCLVALSVIAADIMKAAGVALARAKDVDAKLTVDAIVMATAALLGAAVVTGDPDDFAQLSRHFPAVTVLSA
jgi:hypothetical protein